MVYSVKVETKSSEGERYPYGGLQVKAELRPKSHDGAVVPGRVEDRGDCTYIRRPLAGGAWLGTSVAVVPECCHGTSVAMVPDDI